MYRIKRTVTSGQRVILRDNLKPTGRRIYLDEATQAQLKYLYDNDHPFVEIIPDNVKIEPKRFDKPKKPEDKEIKIKTSGSN
ncbi:hypothetical protein ES703_98125 [subsurface metagenome]